MSDKRCPSQDELLSFVDADLSPEQLARVEKHLEVCSACAKRVMALTSLVQDLGAPLPAEPPLDVALHVAGVMDRLDSRVTQPRLSAWLAWGGGLAAAAAALLLFLKLQAPAGPHELAEGELAARGGPTEASLSRNIGVQLYSSQHTELTALGSGSRIAQSAALTAGLRNLATERAYLLLFALDSRQAVHWIAPEYTSQGSNPEASPITPTRTEKLLPSVAMFDDLAPGPLRVVAVISSVPLHVSDVEALPPAELSAERLLKRFPRAEVRQFLLEVQSEPKP
jgi:hypothetical protein